MLQKSSMERTAEVFFISPSKKQSLIDISRKIKLAHTSVKKNLDNLVKAGLLIKTEERKGSRKFPLYFANLENKLFRKHKIVYNISRLFHSKIVDFIEENLMPRSIVLFGSFQRGEDTEDSDIDLFIECKKEDMDLSSFEKKLGRKIEAHFNDNFDSYPKELKNNIINGFVLSGFLEAFK